MARQQARQFRAIAQTEVFPQMVRLHRPARNHGGKPAALVPGCRTVCEQKIAHHDELIVLIACSSHMPGGQRARVREPALRQGREVFATEAKTFAERPLLHRRHSEQAREDVGVKVVFLYDHSMGDAASRKAPICHGPVVEIVAESVNCHESSHAAASTLAFSCVWQPFGHTRAQEPQPMQLPGLSRIMTLRTNSSSSSSGPQATSSSSSLTPIRCMTSREHTL